MRNTVFIIFIFVIPELSFPQKLKKEDRQLVERLNKHVEYLANDKLEGRSTGSNGEKLAAAYISEEFKKIGLQPKGGDKYYQTFEINEGKAIGDNTYFKIDGKDLLPGKEFFPMPFSGNGAVNGLSSIALKEISTPWFYDLKEWLMENSANPHSDIISEIISKAKEAQRKGASAFIIYNSSSKIDDIKFNPKQGSENISIPVIYITTEKARKILADEGASVKINFQIEIKEKHRSCTNVIGYLDNSANTTVVIGAHYDHLGHGEDGNSREIEFTGQIHNGADDNASGTAALIELARMVKESGLKNNNYLFIAFSGEELGLYGSKYFTSHSTIDLNSINYMVNIDMVGRLNDSTHLLIIGGYGTSPSWNHLYLNPSKKSKLYNQNLIFRFDSSGTGPSDHTSFYLKNIPVLFYFTGMNPDYHKPTDRSDKINYYGEMHVIKHIFSLLKEEDKEKSKLVFLPTRLASTGTTANFKVTLGIMPDYTFSGSGVRIDEISNGRPASRAGLRSGDIIISLGQFKTGSLEQYMQALGKFNKGDKVTLSYIRGTDTYSVFIEF